MEYQEFINTKRREAKPVGFDPTSELNHSLKDFQQTAVDWMIRRGRCALFADTGLGKTLMQLEWASHVWRKTGKPVIVHCPVGVRFQTKQESEKFAISAPVEIVNEASGVINGINLVNYEKMHHFDLSIFSGVVLDESQILKNFTGKTKQQLIEAYRDTPYRLACTATPAPNDHMELGNHADFLGVMPSNEMLSRWFINDTMKAGGYRLKGHGVEDFWRWVSTWAMCISKPSDIGGCDDGYNLPPLDIVRHVVSVDYHANAKGFLFDVHGVSAINIHEEKRRTNEARAAKVAELIAAVEGSCLVWCDTNYEADMLLKAIDGSIDVRGNESEKEKERKLKGFADGEIKLLVTKPEIAGMGLNFQVCNRQIFAGIGFSFERYYQAVRRSWRFGQKYPVTIDIVLSDAESMIEKTIARKENDHRLMQQGMADAMRSVTRDVHSDLVRDVYLVESGLVLPSFLKRESVTCKT